MRRYKKILLLTCITFFYISCIVPSSPNYFNYKNLGYQSLLTLNKKLKISPQLQGRLLPKGEADLWLTLKATNLSNDTLTIPNYDFEIISNKFHYELITASSASGEYEYKLLFDSISESSINKKTIMLPPHEGIKLIITFFNTTPNRNKENFQKLWREEKLELIVKLNKSLLTFTFEAKD